MNDSVHLRNAKALDARNKQMTVEADVLRERVRHLEAQVAMLREDVSGIRQQFAAILVSRGSGPTERH